MVRDKTVLTYHKIYIPSIYIFYIMCVSSILIAVVLCLYSKISVVVVNIFFPVGFFFPCKNNCCIIPINLKLLISLLSNLLVIYPTASAYYLLTFLLPGNSLYPHIRTNVCVHYQNNRYLHLVFLTKSANA